MGFSSEILDCTYLLVVMVVMKRQVEPRLFVVGSNGPKQQHNTTRILCKDGHWVEKTWNLRRDREENSFDRVNCLRTKRRRILVKVVGVVKTVQVDRPPHVKHAVIPVHSELENKHPDGRFN